MYKRQILGNPLLFLLEILLRAEGRSLSNGDFPPVFVAIDGIEANPLSRLFIICPRYIDKASEKLNHALPSVNPLFSNVRILGKYEKIVVAGQRICALANGL